jgi:hypothetical protein
MPKKKQFSIKGDRETEWGEKNRLTLAVTNEGKDAAKKRAEELGISVSEVIERWGRGLPVDGEEQLSTMPSGLPSFRSVMRSLRSFSKRELGMIVRTGLELLLHSSRNKTETVAQMVQENRDVCVVLLEGVIDEERIDAIASGSEPTDKELAHLCSPLGKTYQELRKTSLV